MTWFTRRTHVFAPWVLAVSAWLVACAGLWAHDPGLSTAELHCDADVLQLVVGFAPADAIQLLPESVRPQSVSAVAGVPESAWLGEAKAWCELTSGGTALVAREVRARLVATDAVRFEYVFPRPAGASVVLRLLQLQRLPRGHREFIVVNDAAGNPVARKFLTRDDPLLEIGLPSAMPSSAPGAASKAERPPTAFWGFLQLGIEHIWTGYDHLLFLFALLVVCRSFRSIFAIISCFTLAHSLTLALATLNVVNLPSRIVEPAIAASIVFVGAENLFRRGAEPRGRWALTFAFGLIHGFGFASVLRDLGVGASGGGVGMPLFTFNLGVELGQMAVAAVVLPIVWQLRKREAFVRVGVPVLSGVVAAAGLYWFAMRTVFA